METNQPTKVSLVIFIAAVIALIPTTILYLAGCSISILGFFSANSGTYTPAFLVIAGLLLIPGFGLYCLWWLVFKFRYITLRKIPIYIRVGLTFGSVSAAIFLSPYIKTGFVPISPYKTQAEHLETLLKFGGAPLLVLLVVLFIMALNK